MRSRRKSGDGKLVVAIVLLSCLCVALVTAIAFVVLGSDNTSGQNRYDVALIRSYLKRESPTGTWEEIAWEHLPDGTRLHLRAAGPLGGTIKSSLSLKRSADSPKVWLTGFAAKNRWVDPVNYGVTYPEDAELRAAEKAAKRRKREKLDELNRQATGG